MLKRIFSAVLLGLAVASHGVFAQGMGTTGGDQNAQQQKQDEQKRLHVYPGGGSSPDYHNDDSPNYPFTA